MNRSLPKRKSRDRAFRAFCLMLTVSTFLFMALFIFSIAITSYKSLWYYSIKLNVKSDDKAPDQLLYDSFKILYQRTGLAENSLDKVYRVIFSNRAEDEIAGQLGKQLNGAVNITLSTRVYGYLDDDSNTSIEAKFIRYADQNNLITKSFNYNFFTGKESRDPEFAGILTALLGTILTISICLLISLPLSLFTAIYLEEMVSNRGVFARIIETNIANLASVPSIVYGIIGLAIYIEFCELPRSSSLVGGLTLMLMTIPNLIITYRQALRTVPITIKNAALSLGASKQQMIFHHVVPYCLPGIVTGTILIIARIIGETAPLLMIGMAAFIVDIPTNIFEPATVLPMQIFLWADSPENAFVVKSSAAIMVLLVMLLAISLIALKIRKKYTIKW